MGDGGHGDTLGIRLPKYPNPQQFDSRLGYRGGILDALPRRLYKFLGRFGGLSMVPFDPG